MRKKNKELIPFEIIVMATQGDIDGISYVLRHYAGYIAKLSTRPLYDEHGNIYMAVDEELRQLLEAKLIIKILNFNII